jgi:hypothetical protein
MAMKNILHKGCLWSTWAVLFICLVWGHYGLTPVSDFVGDDWAFLSCGVGRTGLSVAKETALDYYRPLNMMVSRMSFIWMGDRPWAFSLARVVLHGGVLGVFLLLLRALCKSNRGVWIGGALYVFTPILYDEFHWGNHVVLLYYPMAVLGAVLLWVRWVEDGKGWWKPWLSWALYAVGLLSYENCVPLGLVFPLAGLLYGQGRRWRWSGVHLGLAGLYVVYRFTHGFGWGVPAIDAGYYAGGGGLGMVEALQNIRTILSWWVGGMLGQSFLGGFNAFFTLLPKWQFAFVAGSSVVLLAAWGVAHKIWKMEKSGGERRWKNVMFGLAWAGLAYAPHLLFPACSRHNLLPVFGVGIALGALMGRGQAKTPAPVWLLAGLLCMVANAGNGLAWHDAGEFSRRLYQTLQETREEWEGKALVLFDTQSLRERQTRGILGGRNDGQETWACYENSILLRGFVGSGMLKLCAGHPVDAIQDTECGALIEGGVLKWHARYNPAISHETPLEDVYVVDCLAAVIQRGGE